MSIVIDSKIGTHFDGKNIEIGSHAISQAQERFNIPFKRANTFILTNLRKAQFLGEITDEEGKETRLFAYNRICFVLALERDKVITVYERTASPDNLRQSIGKVIADELARMERKLVRKKRQIERYKAELKIEIGEREIERMETRSQVKRLVLTARINALNAHFALLDGDLTELKREQSRLLKGVAVYV